MLTLSDIHVQFGERILLDHIDWVVKPGDKIGLVGRNGAGKSTLLKIIAGDFTPESGIISIPTSKTLGYLHQELQIEQSKSILDETLTAFEELRKVNASLEEVQEKINNSEDYESPDYLKLLEKLSSLTERYALLGGDSAEGEAVKVLKGLGFTDSDLSRKVNEFSGGWQMRIVLAKILLKKPDYLLLDEPTNHLDIESIIWLEKFLSTHPGAVVIVSHDQTFLDNCTNRTVEIEFGKLHDYKACYSDYLEMRKERKEKQLAAYSNQQKIIAQKERTIKRFIAKSSKTKMAQSMQKQLDKMEVIEVDQADSSQMNLRFPPAPRSGQVVLEGKSISKRYGSLEVLNHIDIKVERGQRVAFVGQNGQGKTTLAKILAGKLSYESGSLNVGHNVSMGYYAQNQAETLDRNLSVFETMSNNAPADMQPKVRSILGSFLFSGEDIEKKVSVLSGGERARLSLACLLLRPHNLLILDEPTNHLDMRSKDVLKNALMSYDGSLIVVSHDRHFLSSLSDQVYEFRNKKIKTYLGDVNYFLSKRELDDMRSLELSNTSDSSDSKKSPVSESLSTRRDQPDRKKIERQIQSAERKIEKLEEEIQEIEKRMGEPAFYQDSSSADVISAYNQKKAALDEQYQAWEKYHRQL